MTPVSIALNRFGLGYRADQPMPRDARGWLRDQIRRYDPAPPLLAARGDDTALINDVMREFARTSKMMRSAKREQEEGGEAVAEVRETKRELRRDQRAAYRDDAALRVNVAAASETPFMERLVHFWANHFAIGARNSRIVGIAGAHEFSAIRPKVAGSFRDLLVSASLHPAMLIYLDQHRSIGPNSKAGARRHARNPDKAPGLNENLAREILELHTLGVDGGYTQADVTEFARALTGWTLTARAGRNGSAMGNGAAFVDALHEPGGRRIMGREYAEQGSAQALAILDDLALHPSTARHLATKLTRHFAGDVPPPAMIARLEEAFLDSRGDLPTVYDAIVASPESWVEEPVKFRQPWEWFVGMLRAAGPELVPQRRTSAALEQLGQPAWMPTSPAGYDDRASSWLAPDALNRRVMMAEQVAQKAPPIDVRRLAAQMFPGSLSETTTHALRAAASDKMALTLLLVSPEMLRR